MPLRKKKASGKFKKKSVICEKLIEGNEMKVNFPDTYRALSNRQEKDD